MGDDRAAVSSGQGGDPHRLGDAAASGNVRLEDVDVAALDQVAKFVDGGHLLAGGDPDGGAVAKLAVAIHVVRVEGFFQPENVVLGQHPGTAEGGGVVPDRASAIVGPADIDHDRGVR